MSFTILNTLGQEDLQEEPMNIFMVQNLILNIVSSTICNLFSEEIFCNFVVFIQDCTHLLTVYILFQEMMPFEM